MNSTNQNVSNYYDNFSNRQMKTGVNLRHYYLFNQIVLKGLKKNSSLLEIGCGIGTLTSLLAKYAKNGKLVATDISPKNIELARKNIKHKNVEFFTTNMNGFVYETTFDFIVLADVLEHIPIEEHDNLFKVIKALMHPKSVLFINIPHPKMIEYLRKNKPEQMQIIDQALYAKEVVVSAESCGLMLSEYKSYSLFTAETDYVSLTFRLNQEIHYNNCSKVKIVKQKLLNRLKYHFKLYR